LTPISFVSKLDSKAVEEVAAKMYETKENMIEDDEGNITYDWSEYDPSILETQLAGIIEDEVSMDDINDLVNGNKSKLDKFSLLLDEIFSNHLPILFIDSTKKEIFRIRTKDELKGLIDQHKEALGIYIREYDHSDDY